MKVLLLSRFERLGSSSRLRSFQYLPHLEAAGIYVTVAPLLRDAYLTNLYSGKKRLSATVVKDHFARLGRLLTSRGFDLLWIEAELFPWLPAWCEILLHKCGIPYVVDYDDAVFHRYDLHPSILVRCLLGKKIDRIMRGAALVIAGNDYIAQRAGQAGACKVETLPTVIDLGRYRVAPCTVNDGFTIGWIGSPPTFRHLRLLEEPLRRVCGNGKARVVAVGAGPVFLGEVPLEIRRWSENTEVSEIAGFDVGLMPLPDEPLARGKCGYKLIQYMACGKPVVASPVGINRLIVDDGVNGFLAATEEQWVSCLRRLQEDTALRRRMGREGRRSVEQEYCLQVTAPRLASLLRVARRNRCGDLLSTTFGIPRLRRNGSALEKCE